ncbi:MAG: glycosyltransferase family 1 protein [Merismopedia sp. SIO2A8]|nr:glycosyltransferase family 1 protein [Merismopedia sp. SIO2A8]
MIRPPPRSTPLPFTTLFRQWLPLGYLEEYSAFSGTPTLPDLLALRSLSPQIRQTCPVLDAPLSDRPLDLHFVGTLNRRRELFFARNARWLSQYKCFWHIPPTGDPFLKGKGQALDTQAVVGLSRRSKILLNLHRDDLPYFEWHRLIFFGLWQNTLVLTEPCHDVPGLVAGKHYIACHADELEDKVHWLLNTTEGQREAERVRQAGHEAIKATLLGNEVMQRMVAVMGGGV